MGVINKPKDNNTYKIGANIGSNLGTRSIAILIRM